MRVITIYISLVIMALCGMESASAQLLPERKLVRSGNEAFENKEYKKSLELYNEALEVAPDCYEATYNRANAYHHVMRENNGQDSTISWETSNQYYEEMINNPKYNIDQRAESLRNIGESLMAQENYEAALNAFRESLLLNPNDAETKYNYVLSKRIVDQKRNQQQQNQQQNQNQDQQQDQQQNQNQDQQQDQQQNQNQDQQQNQDQNGGDNNQDQQGDQNQNKNQDQQGDQQSDNQKDKDDNREGEEQQQDGKDGEQEQEQNQDQQQNNSGKGNGEDESESDSDEGDEPQPTGLSDEQERLLDAIQGEEDKTQDKLGEKRKAIYVPGKKNW